MFSLGYGVYLFLFSLGLAVFEIQIEGKHGWAQNLPCWRPRQDSFVGKAWVKITGKKLTGYHASLLSLVFLTLHLPFFLGMNWGLIKELEVISGYFLLWVAEDFLWFVLNPYYGMKNFKPENIWWHKKWVGNVMPMDYPVGIGTGFFFSVIAVVFGGGWRALLDFWMVAAILFSLVLLVVALSEVFWRNR